MAAQVIAPLAGIIAVLAGLAVGPDLHRIGWAGSFVAVTLPIAIHAIMMTGYAFTITGNASEPHIAPAHILLVSSGLHGPFT